MKIELTARDKKLFQAVDSFGVLSTNQIRHLVFQGIDESTMLARLRKLKIKNYLQSHHGLPHGQLVWTLSLKARQLIDSDLEVNLNRNQLEHDVFISEIRMRLEANKVCKSWTSGFKLKQLAAKNGAKSPGQSSQIPDGIFSVQTASGIQVVALELEMVSKSKRRYKEILRNYSSNSKINWVWYVTSQRSLGKYLCTESNAFEYREGQKWLYTSAVADVLNPNAAVIMANEEKSIVLIKAPQANPHPLGSVLQK